MEEDGECILTNRDAFEEMSDRLGIEPTDKEADPKKFKEFLEEYRKQAIKKN